MLQRGLLIWLCGLSVLAYYWTTWFPGWFDPFVASKPLLSWLIALTMLAIGWMLPRDEIAQVVRRWPSVLAGTSLQYLTMPLLAYVTAKLFGLTGDYLLGVVMVGCVPGAMASNVLTLNAGGNTSYSVGLTTTATLLSPVAVPLTLGLVLGVEKQLDWRVLLSASAQLLWMVVLPVVVGHLLSRKWSTSRPWASRLGSTVANLAILWIIAAVVGRGREQLAQAEPVLLAALLVINVGGYLAGYFGGAGLRLPEGMRRALTLEIGMQNAGLGATLASDLFADRPAAAIAPALFTFGCMLTGTLLAWYWGRRGINSPSEPPPDPE